MILAAGLGTRLKPWTEHHPKALAVINKKSLLQRNIEYLQEFGIDEVIVNVHHFANQILDAIDKNKGWGSKILISNETDEVLETGGGLMKASEYLKGTEPFVLMNVDILTDLDLDGMKNYHQEYLPLATLATSLRQTSRYLLFNDENNLIGWRNETTAELKGLPLLSGLEKHRAFSGIHIIDPKIFNLIQLAGKFSMVDVYLNLMKNHSIMSYDHSGDKLLDVGKQENIDLAEKQFV